MPRMMRRLTSCAEAGVARRGHDLLGARGVDALGQHAHAVAHRVELGEVARRLAREDEVVGREGVVEVRAADLDDLGTELLEQGDRLVEAGAHAGLVALAAELLDDADPHAPHVGGAGRLDDRRDRCVDRRRVHRVVAAHDGVQQRGVEDRAAAGAGLVERARERHEAVARDAAVGRLRADRRGDGRGLADRAARCRSRSRAAPGTRRAPSSSRRPSRRGSGRGPTGCATGRRPSARSRSPSRTRPCSSCRGSAGRPRAASSRPSRRTAGSSPRGSGCRTSSARPSSS